MNDANQIDILIMSIGASEYAVLVEHVESIIAESHLTEVPDPGAHLLGMIDLRGKVLPIVNLASLLDTVSVETTGKFVVAQVEGVSLGLRVDAVSEVVSIPAGAIEPAPDSLSGSGWITGIIRHRDHLVTVLDLGVVINRAEAA